MFCKNCGQQLNETDQVCPACNTPVSTVPPANQAPQQPYGTQAQYPPPAQPYGAQPPYPLQQPPVQVSAPLILRIICFLIPIVGIILYFVKKDENRHYAKQCLNASLIAIGIYVAFYILLFVLIMVAGTSIY